jgi:hypothetical protein
LAERILAVVDSARAEIEDSTAAQKKVFLHWLNEGRKRQGLPPATELSLKTLFDTAPIALRSINEEFAQILGDFGATQDHGIAYTRPTGTKEDPHAYQLNMVVDYAAYTDLGGDAVIALTYRYPDLYHNARFRLKTGNHPARQRILQSGYK